MEIAPTPAARAEVRAAQRAFRALPKDLKNELRKAQRSTLAPIWRQEMAAAVPRAAARAGMAREVFSAGTRVKAGLPLYLVAGGSNRRMTGGATPSDLARPYEFGTRRRENLTRYPRTSPQGRRHTATRHTSRQLPLTRRSGYVVYPAASQTIPRLIGKWVLALTDRIRDAAGGN